MKTLKIVYYGYLYVFDALVVTLNSYDLETETSYYLNKPFYRRVVNNKNLKGSLLRIEIIESTRR